MRIREIAVPDRHARAEPYVGWSSGVMIPAAYLVAMVAGEANGEPNWSHFDMAGIAPVSGKVLARPLGTGKEPSMKHSFFLVIALLALLAAPVAAQEASPVASPTAGAPSAVASGLINPRGFVWTEDGTLYVAQAGTGGEVLGTPAVEPPLGPFHGGPSGSVVRIEAGCPILLAGDLPSAVFTTGEVLGAEDRQIFGGHLYASVDGGGESHGNAAHPSGVYRILENGSTELVADLLAWVRANPVEKLPLILTPTRPGLASSPIPPRTRSGSTIPTVARS
jgi:hypothetical protein